MKGMIVFHRHGHRAPALNIKLNPSFVLDQICEISLWKNKLFSPTDLGHLEKFRPLIRASSNSIPKDLQTFPVGCLTKQGKIGFCTSYYSDFYQCD